MKRFLAALLCLLICLTALFSCGEKEYNIDKAALAAALVEADCFADTLIEVPSQMLKYSYQVSEDVSAVLYRGTNTTAEEITVFEAPDAEAAKTVLETANAYLTTLAATYDQYNAKEAARIRGGIVIRRGRYVIVCICNNNAAAEKVINEYCK